MIINAIRELDEEIKLTAQNLHWHQQFFGFVHTLTITFFSLIG